MIMASDFITMEEARQIVRDVLPQGRITASSAGRKNWTVSREKDLSQANEIYVTYPSGVKKSFILI